MYIFLYLCLLTFPTTHYTSPSLFINHHPWSVKYLKYSKYIDLSKRNGRLRMLKKKYIPRNVGTKRKNCKQNINPSNGVLGCAVSLQQLQRKEREKSL